MDGADEDEAARILAGLQANHQQPPAAQPDLAQVMAAMTVLLQQNAQMIASTNNARGTATYHVMPDMSHNLGQFDGLSGVTTARTWLRQLESSAVLHRWTNAVAFETARSNLTKGARNWYLANLDTTVDWASFKKAFSNRFLIERTLTEKYEEMKTRCQRQGENTREYFFDKLRFCKALNFGSYEIKQQIAIGLWSRDTSTMFLSRAHFDEDDMLRNLLEIEALENARKQRIHQGRANPIHSATEGTSQQRKEGAAAKPRSTGDDARAGISRNFGGTSGDSTKHNASAGTVGASSRECYRCHATGHIAKDCPVKREVVCYNCDEKGHFSKNCTKPRKAIKSEIAFFEREDCVVAAKYLKKVTIGRVTDIVALIDPGSSDCTIKSSLVLEHGFVFKRNPSKLVGFGKSDNEVHSSGVIEETVRVDECEIDGVRFRVIPDDVQPYAAIIGRNFTELPEVAYYKCDEQLEFKKRENFIFNVKPDIEPSNSKLKLEAAESASLPSGSVKFLNVKVNNDQIKLPFYNSSTAGCDVTRGEEIKSHIMCIKDDMEPRIPRVEPITIEDINAGPALDVERKRELLQLLNEYRECSAMNESELGCTQLIEMDIVEKSGSEPVYAKPYKANARQRERMREIVGAWKRAGIVTETDSPYASPCLLTGKGDRSDRLVVDYRRLNQNTVRMNFPMPSIDEGMEFLHGQSVFAVLDLAQGYLQVPLSENAKAKTAFITPDETGQFERAMFGLMNAAFYFAKLMKMVFHKHSKELALVYFDDILIFARSWGELLVKLRKILQLLKDAGLTLNLRKCKFGLEQVEYVGFIVSKDGVQPGKQKVRALLEFPTPRNVHEVRRFHGMASFFRRFIPQFARIVAPLVQLFKKDNEFVWGEAQRIAFQIIKEKLGSEPVLAHYNANATCTELHTDASIEGLGDMLFQSDDRQVMHLVYAVSRRTSEVERAYHSSKLEFLAIVWPVERLRTLLIGIHFTVITDCQALVYVNSTRAKNPQFIRWVNALADYDYEILHRKGDKMGHVDALSRAPVEEYTLERAEMFSLRVHEDEILMYQRSDENLARKIRILEKLEKERSPTERGEVCDYCLRDGILFRRSLGNTDKELYVIPKAMRKGVVIKNHDLRSHFGVDRTVTRIMEHYYFPRMRAYVRRHIAACIDCLLAKRKTGRQAGELHPIPAGQRPFSLVHLDHLGPFVSSCQKNKYVLAAICNLTRFIQLYAVRDVKASSTVRKLQGFIDKFGAPNRFVTDRGTAFTAGKFAEFCNAHGVKHTLNSSRHPQANGLVERLNQTLLPAIRCNVVEEDGRDWDKCLVKIERDLNTSVNKTTGKTPFELLYGYTPRFEEGPARQLTESTEQYTDPKVLQHEARTVIFDSQLAAKERYDANRLQNVKFELGDIVFMTRNPTNTGDSTKLQPRTKGPLVITQVLPSDTYRVQALTARGTSARNTTAHVSQLRIWRGAIDESDSEVEECTTSEGEELPESTDTNEESRDGAVETACTSPKVAPPNVRPDDRSVEVTLRRGFRNKERPRKLDDYVTNF